MDLLNLQRWTPMLTRRHFIGLGLTSAAVSIVAGSCSSGGGSGTPVSTSAGTDPDPDPDPAAAFSGFEPADEPNGDLSKVEWPSFVTDADPEVKELYEFQITHGELMRYMPCFCGCGNDAGHRSNRDCYVESVGADGTVVLDSMAPT